MMLLGIMDHFFHQDGRQTMMLHVRIHCKVDHMKTLFLVELVILFLVGCAYTCLSFYTPLAIGHSFAQHKMLLSVAFFFAIEVVVQIISGIALIAGLPALDNLFFWANTNLSPAGAIHGFMWGCIGYTAVFTVVLYCLTIRMLHRHLNLE